MPLRVVFQGGPRAGQAFEFGDDVAEIRFGRDPARCQVVFDADDTGVGREHCALQRVLSDYRIVLNGRSPVQVDGRPAHDGQVLAAQASLQFGEHGPRMMVQVMDATGLLPTDLSQPRAKGVHTRLEEAGGAARSGKRTALVAAGALVLVAAAGWAAVRGLREDVRTTQDTAEVARADAGRAQSAADATKTEVAEVRTAVAKLQTQVMTDAGRARFAQAVEDAKQPPAAPPPSMADRIAAIEPSIYLVVKRTAGGQESTVATAWVTEGPPPVGRCLATNAHVVEEFERLAGGDRLVARSTGPNPADLTIMASASHPAYLRLKRLASEMVPGDPRVTEGSSAMVKTVTDCDVGLLRVADADRAKLAKPLPLASRKKLLSIRSGMPIAYAGYPLEGVNSVDPKRPKPHSAVGHVTSVSDFLLGSTDPDSAEVVHHDLPTYGGSSGSPIIDEDGEVIAVHNAGQYLFFDVLADGTLRFPKDDGAGRQTFRLGQHGLNFAQRADLLSELLDGTAAAKSVVRVGRAKRELARFAKDRKETCFAWCVDGYRDWMMDRDATLTAVPVVAVGETSGKITGAGAAGGAGFEWKSPVAGHYLLVAVPRGLSNINLAVVVAGKTVADDASAELCPSIAMDFAAGAAASIGVYVPADAAPGTEYDLRIYRADVVTARDHLERAYAAYEAKTYARSAEEFEKALGEPSVRGDLARANLYNGACSAALTWAGAKGDGASARLRALALEWLAEDLKLRREQLAAAAKAVAEATPAGADKAAKALAALRTDFAKHEDWARTGDPDLESLRAQPEFRALFADAK